MNYLYVVDIYDMHIFDINNPSHPKKSNIFNIGWGIETIFPYKDKLFIGSETGMYIYDNSNPEQPEKLSTFLHVRACDPVVADDRYAYVTLRSGSSCAGINNQLDVIDIKDPSNPKLVKSYPMKNPHGVGIKGNNLFICEGDNGLKVFDVSEVETKIDILTYFPDIHSYDVIPYDNYLLLIGDDGFYQYDFSNPEELKLLSKIEIQR